MARKLQTNPRKSASQERSRATVDALLEVTARVLINQGYDRASTNKIAEVAGVSIGSLYQYFPSKEALVGAVIDRHAQQVSEVTRNAVVKMAARPIDEAAREFVSVAIDAHRINPKLHGVLSEQIPRVGRLENIEANLREGYALVRGYLNAHLDEIDVADPDLAAFVCVTVVEALTHAAVFASARPPGRRESTKVCGQRQRHLLQLASRLCASRSRTCAGSRSTVMTLPGSSG